MKRPFIRRVRPGLRREDGITIVLVAVAMVAIVAMAALSIDVVTLYLARMEAQRAADAGALAAARVISVSGLTGDPGNTSGSWGPVCGNGGANIATQAGQAAATQSSVDGVVPTVTVKYSAGTAAPVPDCSSGLPAAFSVNPLVTVQVTRNNLPTFFSRLWGNTGNTVNATAVAEAFNSSNSGTVTGGTTIIPVQPRCVKPWVVPNADPLNPGTCTTPGTCTPFVDTGTGSIEHPGISLNGGNANGVIGETFWLSPDCVHNSSPCQLRKNPPEANYHPNPSFYEPPPSLQYLPGQVLNASTAVASCSASGSLYEEAIEGCDQSTVYQCGVQNMNTVDLSESPGDDTNDTLNGVQCLIHQTDPRGSQPTGQDYLNPYGAPSSFPFHILAGTSNPIHGGGLPAGNQISASNSIVSLPIYDSANNAIRNTGTSPVTIVGFLQVFINTVDQHGNVNVTVLNVTGCSNGSGGNVGTAVTGSSPVPVRLITAP